LKRREGNSLCERALERDERNVRALVNLSFKFTDRILSEQSSDRDADVRQAGELVSRALAVDPNDYGAHFARAEILLGQQHFEEAMIEAERSLSLNPSFVSAYSALSVASSFLGQPQQASSMLTKRCTSARAIQTCMPFI
jgi:lipopolysaccharide biosynthesis regulator YciM